MMVTDLILALPEAIKLSAELKDGAKSVRLWALQLADYYCTMLRNSAAETKRRIKRLMGGPKMPPDELEMLENRDR